MKIKKPIEALKLTVIFTLQFLALLCLRLVLWIVFFLLPLGLLLSVAFHVVTHQAKKLAPEGIASSSPYQDRGASHNPLTLKTLSEDIRFWFREFERLRS